MRRRHRCLHCTQPSDYVCHSIADAVGRLGIGQASVRYWTVKLGLGTTIERRLHLTADDLNLILRAKSLSRRRLSPEKGRPHAA